MSLDTLTVLARQQIAFRCVFFIWYPATCGPKQGQWAYSVQVRSVSALGSAMLCQLQWSTPPVCQNVAAVSVCDRALARDFIRRTREDILHQLKTAFRELVVSEQFHHQSCSYFATLGAKRPASDSGSDSDKGDPKGKK